jgi:hypothetical protein
MKKCRTCSEKFRDYIEQRSLCTTRKMVPDGSHFHYGLVYYRYGICSRHHYSRIQKTKIIWDPCIRCRFKGVTRYKICTEEKKEIVSLRLEIRQLREEMEKYRRKIYTEKKLILQWKQNLTKKSSFPVKRTLSV